MSEVSFIPSPPAAASRATRAPERSAAAHTKAPAPVKAEPAPAPEAAHKTKVKTEQLSKFTFGYTFLDPETLRIVGQFPVTPPLGAYRK